jgi:hypothetical protein
MADRGTGNRSCLSIARRTHNKLFKETSYGWSGTDAALVAKQLRVQNATSCVDHDVFLGCMKHAIDLDLTLKFAPH